MKTPKLAGVFLVVGCLLTYLIFVKHHSGSTKPEAHSLPASSAQLGNERPAAAAGAGVQYCIMFDAGSTGTRIHIFQFQMEDKGAVEGRY